MLHNIAKEIADRHVHCLNMMRQSAQLYKRLDNKHRPIGRPFKENGQTFIKNQQAGIRMIRLQPIDKKGDPRKYNDALNSIITPCAGGCNKRHCIYCALQKRGIEVPSHPTHKILFAIHQARNEQWGMLRQENNLAPTKKLLKLLGENRQFMLILILSVLPIEQQFLLLLILRIQ